MTADDVRDLKLSAVILKYATTDWWKAAPNTKIQMLALAATLERLAAVHGHDDPGLPSMDYVEGVCDGIEAYSDTLRNEARIAAAEEGTEVTDGWRSW
jgi:hypothetical protein